MKKFYLAPIKAYQYISKMLPANCRYYPTCSEYTKWQFEINRADKALVRSTLRILKCNQLFEGGIDYPIIEYKTSKLLSLCNRFDIKIKYWIVPKKGKEFFVIKDFSFNEN
ncbi:MAG: membrane protein insertion efficiency factor YidD [Sulfurovaceae bacterium]|nr:membrane protein insertion efficiency factor YidD [Sulfurovaceae bacterium]